jgi:hypothetical protein
MDLAGAAGDVGATDAASVTADIAAALDTAADTAIAVDTVVAIEAATDAPVMAADGPATAEDALVAPTADTPAATAEDILVATAADGPAAALVAAGMPWAAVVATQVVAADTVAVVTGKFNSTPGTL